MALKNLDIISLLEENSIQEVTTIVYEKAKNVPGTSTKFNTYFQRIKRLIDTHKKLNKTKSSQEGRRFLDVFLEREFQFPLSQNIRDPRGQQVTTKEIQSLQPSTETSAAVLKDIATELQHERAESTRLVEEVERKESELKTLKVEHEENLKLKEKKRLELKRTRLREDYYRKKIMKLEREVGDKPIEERKSVEKVQPTEESKTIEESKDLKAEVGKLKAEIIELQYQLEMEQDSRAQFAEVTLDMYDEDEGKYSKETQMCVHKLLENHVSTTRVRPVIEACLQLAGKKANRLPSATTVNNMNVQRLVLSQKQIAEEFSRKVQTTIETDETSKFGVKYGVFGLRDPEGTAYVLGLREMTTKSAKDTLETLKDILFDLDSRYYTAENPVSQNILFQIRNTMSDRAATEKKFNELLEMYRKEILPEMVSEWEQLPDEDKNILGRLNNFFCGLHSLVHLAEVSDRALREVEQSNFNGNVPILNKKFEKAESGTTRLIRTVCKAFSYQGDPKSGCHDPFMIFIRDELKIMNFQSLPLTPFKGNRFNILFHNAGVVYLFHAKMTEFLEGHSSNKWVLHDLKIPFFLAGCKALGLICKLVTTPLWHLIERKDIHIMDMNGHYLQLTNYLKDSTNNLEEFMSGRMLPFKDDTHLKRDRIFEALITPSDHDADTGIILSVILPAMAKLLESHFAEHLPGGKYENASEQLRVITESVEKHNKFSESVFAYLDRLLRFKPHLKTLSAEAYVMFAVNKTSSWLEKKNAEEIEREMKEAYKDVEKTRRMYKERKDEIRRRKAEILREKMEKAEASRKKHETETAQQMNDMLYWGLWQTTEQVEMMLDNLSGKEKVEALKAQLRFRKNILNQVASDKSLFLFTKATEQKRASLDWTEMAENVKTLIRESFSAPTESKPDSVKLVGRNIKHKFNVEGTDNWFKGHVISQVSLFNVVLINQVHR